MSRALSFGHGADDYDRVRPEYSAEALDLVTERLGLSPDAEVLDLAAGTGKLTRPLVERFARVTAVEPDPGMLARLRRVTDCYAALEGRAEEIPLPDGSVDVVFVGQAFHWFSTDEALTEIARVLRPVGGLVLIWNAWTKPEPPEPEDASRIIEEVVERVSGEPVRDRSHWLRLFDASPLRLRVRRRSRPDRWPSAATTSSRSPSRPAPSACCRRTSGRPSSRSSAA